MDGRQSDKTNTPLYEVSPEPRQAAAFANALGGLRQAAGRAVAGQHVPGSLPGTRTSKRKREEATAADDFTPDAAHGGSDGARGDLDAKPMGKPAAERVKILPAERKKAARMAEKEAT